MLVVGTEPEFPPFESLDENGELVGFDIDLARAIAKDLGVDVRFETMAFDSLPSALGVGKIDVILSGMTATPERAKSRTFTDSYFRTQLCLLVGTRLRHREPRDADGEARRGEARHDGRHQRRAALSRTPRSRSSTPKAPARWR